MTILPLLRVTNTLRVTCKQSQLLCRGQWLITWRTAFSEFDSGFILAWPALRKKLKSTVKLSLFGKGTVQRQTCWPYSKSDGLFSVPLARVWCLFLFQHQSCFRGFPNRIDVEIGRLLSTAVCPS